MTLAYLMVDSINTSMDPFLRFTIVYKDGEDPEYG